MKDIEIEIQVRINGSKKLEDFLNKNAKSRGKKYQKDEYYTPQHRDFLATKPTAEWLRIRESGSNSVTYKNWYFDDAGKSQYCDEYETVIEDVDQMRKIFASIDIKPIITVEKTRKLWDYQDYEIAIDYVTGLGDFVEIEYKGHDASVDPKTVTDDMISLLKKIGCTKIERNYVGYPYMLLNPNEQVFEVV